MFSLHLFGGASLHGDSGPLTGTVVQRRRLAFLSILAVSRDRGVSRDKLVALLWPETDTESARHFLADSLYALRKSLGKDAILAVGDDLLLNPAVVHADVGEFQEALAHGDGERAVALYRGPFLDGFYGSDTSEFEPWAEGERERLARDYAHTLEALAEEREREESFPVAAEWWRRLAAHDPYNSRTAVRLMRALEATGDRAGALQHAQLHTTLLREEFGAQPDPDVESLAVRLRSEPVAREEHPTLLRMTGQAGLATDPKDELPNFGDGRPDGATAFTASNEPAATARAVAPVIGPRPQAKRRHRVRYAALAIGLGGLVLAAGVVRGGWRDRTGAPPGTAAPIRSLAVLPLENLSGDPEQAYFADGMTDALITELAGYDQLRVISRTSSMQYKEARKPLPVIAQELKVDAVVEGTVLRYGDRIRITAQLIRASTDEHLWAKSYERDVRDVLALQSEIAEAIAREIHVATAAGERAETPRVDPASHALYLRGRYAALKRSREGLEQAATYYRQAIERDPEFALAYAGLADAYMLLGAQGYFPPGQATDSGVVLAGRAIELDSTLSEAHTSLGAVLGNQGEWRAADRAFRRAIELQPGNALAHHWYALLLVPLGRGEQALDLIRRAQTLDPLSPSLLGAAGQIELAVGSRQAAIERFREAIQLEPLAPWPHHSLGFVYLAEGRCPEALAEVQMVSELAPRHPRSQAGLAAYHARCGDRARAHALLDPVVRHPDASSYALPIAITYAALRDKDSAFVWLDRSHWNLAMRVNLQGWPILADVRADPRYAALLGRIGLKDLPQRQIGR